MLLNNKSLKSWSGGSFKFYFANSEFTGSFGRDTDNVNGPFTLTAFNPINSGIWTTTGSNVIDNNTWIVTGWLNTTVHIHGLGYIYSGEVTFKFHSYPGNNYVSYTIEGIAYGGQAFM